MSERSPLAKPMTNTERYLSSKPSIDPSLYCTEAGLRRLMGTRPTVVLIDENYHLPTRTQFRAQMHEQAREDAEAVRLELLASTPPPKQDGVSEMTGRL